MTQMMTIREAVHLRDRLRIGRSTVGATSGCFDLLHVGHVRMLQAAKAQCDCLIVLLNSDQSVHLLKGEGRPIHCWRDRAEILLALSCVDEVTIFTEETPEGVLHGLQPDIWYKGGDYRDREIPEAAVVESYGGKVIILPYWEGYSTTTIYKNLQKFEGEDNCKKI